MKALKSVDLVSSKRWTSPRVVYDEVNPPGDLGISFIGDPGMTDASQAEACDFNVIVKQAVRTGYWPTTDREALYGDFSDMPSYQEAYQLVEKAHDQFMSLNADVRKRFGNDPALFLQFATDESNAAEMIRLGLATERKSPPSPADPVPAAPQGKA